MNITQRILNAAHNLPDSLHPVLRHIYAARHITDARQLELKLEHLSPPAALKGMDLAVALLTQALRDRQRILIVADFDADGATSCALAVRALRLLGAYDVRYVVPNRFEYGYGLTPEIVAVAAQQQPQLIITVDNGISSIEGVACARAHGMRVLITDHHLPGAALPAADAIVNPNQPDDTFPSKHIAGVGVIFYIMLALRAQLRESAWFGERGIGEPNLAQLLDLVALGTVADVAQLDHTNRILVAQGLARIRERRCSAGLLALLQVAGRIPARINAADLGFAVAPRLNAAGRLEDMSLGIECLLSDEPDAALAMAQRLDELNRERRGIEAEMQTQALAALDNLRLDGALSSGLCLFDPGWHQGVIGILASRIKDRLHRPVIAFAPASDSEIKGSARSVQGVHIRDALDAVATRHPGLLSKFGGHAMAAGLTLKRADLDAFRAAFDDEIKRHLSPTQMQGTLLSDGALPAADINLELAETLRNAGPWGQGFPEPVFDGVFEIRSQRLLNDKHLKLSLQHPGAAEIYDAIAFNIQEQSLALVQNATRIHVAYKLDVNNYRDRRSVQLLIEHIEPAV
ncbi:MAG: single-stranded-DNA-specific exonuclease RecJ [Gammaproteobacteria bacterium]|nr:MAG: single-stranded-DNA-specific exonuclease RecJ [Gammaproteobacteria bacterium]